MPSRKNKWKNQCQSIKQDSCNRNDRWHSFTFLFWSSQILLLQMLVSHIANLGPTFPRQNLTQTLHLTQSTLLTEGLARVQRFYHLDASSYKTGWCGMSVSNTVHFSMRGPAGIIKGQGSF